MSSESYEVEIVEVLDEGPPPDGANIVTLSQEFLSTCSVSSPHTERQMDDEELTPRRPRLRTASFGGTDSENRGRQKECSSQLSRSRSASTSRRIFDDDFDHANGELAEQNTVRDDFDDAINRFHQHPPNPSPRSQSEASYCSSNRSNQIKSAKAVSSSIMKGFSQMGVIRRGGNNTVAAPEGYWDNIGDGHQTGGSSASDDSDANNNTASKGRRGNKNQKQSGHNSMSQQSVYRHFGAKRGGGVTERESSHTTGASGSRGVPPAVAETLAARMDMGGGVSNLFPDDMIPHEAINANRHIYEANTRVESERNFDPRRNDARLRNKSNLKPPPEEILEVNSDLASIEGEHHPFLGTRNNKRKGGGRGGNGDDDDFGGDGDDDDGGDDDDSAVSSEDEKDEDFEPDKKVSGKKSGSGRGGRGVHGATKVDSRKKGQVSKRSKHPSKKQQQQPPKKTSKSGKKSMPSSTKKKKHTSKSTSPTTATPISSEPYWKGSHKWKDALPEGFVSHAQYLLPHIPFVHHFSEADLLEMTEKIPEEMVAKKTFDKFYGWVMEEQFAHKRFSESLVRKIMSLKEKLEEKTFKGNYKRSWLTEVLSPYPPPQLAEDFASDDDTETTPEIETTTITTTNQVVTEDMTDPNTGAFLGTRKGLMDKMTGKIIQYTDKWISEDSTLSQDVVHRGHHYYLNGWQCLTSDGHVRNVRAEAREKSYSDHSYYQHPIKCSEQIYQGDDFKQVPWTLFIQGQPKFQQFSNVPPITEFIIHGIDKTHEGQCCQGCMSKLCPEYKKIFATSRGLQPFPCGGNLRVGELCFADGRDCHLNANVYYVGVYRVIANGKTSCKIGVVKVLHDLVGYVLNKYCIIQAVKHALPAKLGGQHKQLVQTLMDKEMEEARSMVSSGKRKRENNDFGNNHLGYGNNVPEHRFDLSSKYFGVLSDDVDHKEKDKLNKTFVSQSGGAAVANVLDMFGLNLV